MPSQVPPSQGNDDFAVNVHADLSDRHSLNSSELGDDDALTGDLEWEVSAVAEMIQTVAQRFEAIETVIEQRSSQLRQKIKVAPSALAKAQLEQEAKALHQQIEALRITFANELLPMTLFQGIREVFWQVVRLGGLGFGLGWLVRSWLS